MYLVTIKFYEGPESVRPSMVSYSVEADRESQAEFMALGLFLGHYSESDECAVVGIKNF